MTKQQEMVREFHRVFGLTINESLAMPSQADVELRDKLHREEFCEIVMARDLISLADGYADLKYVLLGTAVTFGANPHGLHVSQPPEALDIALANLHEAALIGNIGEVERLIGRCLACISNRCQSVNIPLNECFAEVHRSNMTKLWTKIEVLEKFKGQKTSAGPTYFSYRYEDGHVVEWQDAANSKANDTTRSYVVKRADGKVIKSPSYEKADLAKVLAIANETQ
jgi:predicted HAD superfamily Cof-like phosphohydrolase